MSKLDLSRRSLLKALGIGGAAAALPMLRPRRARGGTEPVPKRIVFFYGGSGSLPGFWEPLPAPGMPEPTETQFELNDLHQPIAAYKDRTIWFENLDMVSKTVDPTPPANAHLDASTHTLTANNRLTDRQAGAISIDQFIAQQLNTPTPITLLPSLEVMGSEWFYGDEGDASWAGPGSPMPYMLDPTEIWNRLFPTPLDDSDRIAAQRARAFEMIQAEHQSLLGRLGSEDRIKVQQHLQTRSDLQARLGLTSSRAANRPDPSILDPWGSINFRWDVDAAGKAAIWNATCDLNIRLAVAALHTDATRVVNISIVDAPGYTFGYSDGQYGSTDAHDLTHQVNDPYNPLQDPAARDAIRRQHLATSQKLALLLDLLAEAGETDGQSLLDHTLVVWTSQIANGSHATERLPWIVVGGMNGYFRTGRYLRFPRTTDPQATWRTNGRPHNDLFVSLANAMDLPITSFGNPAVCTGPITQMR